MVKRNGFARKILTWQPYDETMVPPKLHLQKTKVKWKILLGPHSFEHGCRASQSLVWLELAAPWKHPSALSARPFSSICIPSFCASSTKVKCVVEPGLNKMREFWSLNFRLTFKHSWDARSDASFGKWTWVACGNSFFCMLIGTRAVWVACLATLEATILLAILFQLLYREAIGTFLSTFLFLFLLPIPFLIFAG